MAFLGVQSGHVELPQDRSEYHLTRLPCHDQAVFLYHRFLRACNERENDHSLEDPTSPAEAARDLKEFLDEHQAEILQVSIQNDVLWIKTPRSLALCNGEGLDFEPRGIQFIESWYYRHIQIWNRERSIYISVPKVIWFQGKQNLLCEYEATARYSGRCCRFEVADQNEFLSMVSRHIQTTCSNYQLVDSACRWNGSMIGLSQSWNWRGLDGVPGITDREILVVPRYTPQRFVGDDLFHDAELLKE